MKFGLSLDSSGPGMSVARRIDALVELARAAEGYGYDSVWIGETYPEDPSRMMLLPAVLVVLASMARDTRLRLGSGVLLLPAHDPLALAYETAVLDQICEGRLSLGVGVAHADLQRRFGIDPATVAARSDETIALLRALWRGESYRGEMLSAEPIAPLPVQPGGPPILVAGYVRRSAERAAEQDGYYAGTPCSPAVLSTQVRRYRETLSRLGKNTSAGVISINRLALVASTEREALELGRRHIAPIVKIYADQGSFRRESRPTTGTAVELFDRFHEDYCLVGTPDQVTERVRRYAKAGVTHVQLRVAAHDMPLELSMRTVELFGTEVLPRFAGTA